MMIRRDLSDRGALVAPKDEKEWRRWPSMVVVGDPTEGGHARFFSNREADRSKLSI